MSLEWIFLGGKKINNITSVTLVNNTAKDVDITVPTGKRWMILGVRAVNADSVNRVMYTFIYNEAAKTSLIEILDDPGTINAGSSWQWPSGRAPTSLHISSAWHIIILEAGNTINIHYNAGGASAGSVDADGLVVQALEIDV